MKQITTVEKRATVTLYFDSRASQQDMGVVKWSICFNRKQRLVTTGLKISRENWEFLQQYKAGLKGHVKDASKRELWYKAYDHFSAPDGTSQVGYLKRAQDVINQLGDRFTFSAFTEQIVTYGKEPERAVDQTNVLEALVEVSATMRKKDRVGNADMYELAAKSLGRFVDSFTAEQRKEFLNIPIPRKHTAQPLPVTLHFDHLTPPFFEAYEQWMLSQGKAPKVAQKPATGASLTTVGIYLRHVRAVVGKAVKTGLLPTTAYPFGEGRYVIPAGNNVKQALARTDLNQIKAFQPVAGTTEQRSHDLWLFTYYSNGMNMADLCRITWSQIDFKRGTIEFVRTKTQRTKKGKREPVTVQLNAETRAILDRWSVKDRTPNGFVFPFLSVDMDEARRKTAVKQVIKTTNLWMKRIASQLGIEANVKTYAARHSFATNLLKGKASLAFISRSLGHTNLKTTESYLGSFDDEEAKGFLSVL